MLSLPKYKQERRTFKSLLIYLLLKTHLYKKIVKIRNFISKLALMKKSANHNQLDPQWKAVGGKS